MIMKDEQINIAIAEACGWKYVNNETHAPDGSFWWSKELEIPDYCNDLNAMHEAENHLPSDKKEDYWYQLYENCRRSVFSRVEDNYKMLHATAAQRARAFLRTINKWEGGSDDN
jgi:hypothetical protein